MPVKTRRQRKKSMSKRRAYRKRVKSSGCRGKVRSVCVTTSGCKYTNGRKRKFCRKSRNARLTRRKSR